MSMTKKDYELIALVIRTTNENGDLDGAVTLAVNFEAVLKKENPKFDGDKFLAACGVK